MRYVLTLLLSCCFLSIRGENIFNLDRHGDQPDDHGVGNKTESRTDKGDGTTTATTPDRHHSEAESYSVNPEQSRTNLRGKRIRAICQEDPSYPLCRHIGDPKFRDVFANASQLDLTISAEPSTAMDSSPGPPPAPGDGASAEPSSAPSRIVPSASLPPSQNDSNTAQPAAGENRVPTLAPSLVLNEPGAPGSNPAAAPSTSKLPTISEAPSGMPVVATARGLPTYAYALVVVVPGAAIALICCWWCRTRGGIVAADDEDKRLQPRPADDGSDTTLLSGSYLNSVDFDANMQLSPPIREGLTIPADGDILMPNDLRGDDVSVLSLVGDREQPLGEKLETIDIVGFDAKSSGNNDDSVLGDFGGSHNRSSELEFSKEFDDLSIDSQLEYSSNDSSLESEVSTGESEISTVKDGSSDAVHLSAYAELSA